MRRMAWSPNPGDDEDEKKKECKDAVFRKTLHQPRCGHCWSSRCLRQPLSCLSTLINAPRPSLPLGRAHHALDDAAFCRHHLQSLAVRAKTCHPCTLAVIDSCCHHLNTTCSHWQSLLTSPRSFPKSPMPRRMSNNHAEERSNITLACWKVLTSPRSFPKSPMPRRMSNNHVEERSNITLAR